jgi:hypothetical protein
MIPAAIPPGRPAPCGGAPTISSITAATVAYNACASGKWTYNATATLSGTLKSWQELYWEINRNQGSWVFSQRTTGTVTSTLTDENYGSSGPGISATHYFQARAYIVPKGKGTGSACSGPVTSNEISKSDGFECTA